MVIAAHAFDWSARARARGMRVAGFAIILLSAGAALLPVDDGLSSDLMGALLLSSGLIEMIAGSLRRNIRIFAMAAGGVTAAAGLMFLLNEDARIFPAINLIVMWLFVRSILLAVAGIRLQGAIRRWSWIAGATDALLGAILLIGLSLSSAVILIFGPTPDMIASFAWVLALSFVVTGTLLLQVASCERDSAGA